MNRPFFPLQWFATFLRVIAGVKGLAVNSPATADTPFPVVLSGQSPQQLLRDLQQQLLQLHNNSKTNKEGLIRMGKIVFFFNSAEGITHFHSNYV
jgi:hypothetical protein